jgi:prepilin-type processing-associated H-X9-DG protein
MRPFHRRPSTAALLGLLAALCLSAACRAQEPPARPAKPTLYVLAVGVSQYKDSTENLQFPAKDAVAVAARFQAQEGKLFGKVIVTTLTDKATTRQAIVGSLTALRHQAAQMRPDDCTILYFDGHAATDDLGQYFFAPYDVDIDNLDATGVSWLIFSETLATLHGHVLLVLNTCHSGGAVSTATAAVFAACAKGELTQEDAAWGHSAFAKALLDGLNGSANDDHDGVVTLAELARYVGRRVPALTGSAQNPVLVTPASFPADLPLAVVAHPPTAPPAK